MEIIKSKEQKQKKIEEKWAEPKGPVVFYQADQHTHFGSPRKRKEREMGRKNIMKDMKIKIQQVQQAPSKMN